MRLSGFSTFVLAVMPLMLFAQGWTFTPSAYPAVCTNPAVVGQWTMDYAAATNRAALDHKRLYLFIVGSTWCPDCNGLETQVVGKPAFKEFMAASDAYWVWLDFPNRKATNSTQYAWLCHTNTGLFTLEASESLLARNRLVESAYAGYRKYRSPTTINMPTLLVLRSDGAYQGELTHYRQLTNVTAQAFISKIGRVWNDDAWDVQDNRVPGKSDDASASATPLTNIVEEVTRQAHTLSPTDAADWYAFSAQPGRTYTFAAEGRLVDAQASLPAGQVSVDLFTTTNATALPVASAAGALGDNPTVSWTLNQARPLTCYVKVGGAFSDVAGYRLAYSDFNASATPGDGTVGFVAQGAGAEPFANPLKPAARVREGNELVLWLGRAGGAGGEVAATVETVGGTALPGVHFAAESVNVVWPNNDSAPKRVSIATLVSAAVEADKTFTVRIRQTTASGTTSGAAAVTVTLRDQFVAQSLNEDAGAALKYTASGAALWFVGDAGELRCAPVPAGNSTTLKTAVKGPGRLTFGWGFLPTVNAASRLVVKVGSETRAFLAGAAAKGSETFYVAKAGTQTVTWQLFADGGQPAAVAFSNLVWQPLQKASSPLPAQNFVCAGSPDWLKWAAVPAADAYRVYLGDSAGELVRVLPEGTITETQIDPCLECVLTEEMKHYWRVDAVMALPGGGEVVVKGDVWPFSIKSWDGPVTTLPKFEETEGLQLTSAGAYRLVAGVQVALGPFEMFYDCGCGDDTKEGGSDPLSYGLVGKLPPGLSMKNIDGATHFVGVPDKAGDYALWVQSRATVEGGNVIGSTLPLAFSVVPLRKAAGQFNGWVGNADDPRKNGSVALTVSEAGRLTAKVQVGGKTVAFSKNGFDAETNGTVYVRLETAVTADGVPALNVLALALSMASGEGTGSLTVSGAAPSVSGVTLVRDSWKEPGLAELAAACAGYYTVALPVTSATEQAPQGSGYLTLTIAKTGGVKLSGLLADGKSWSASSTLLASEEREDLGKAGVRTNTALRVLVYAAQSVYKNAGGVCGLLRLVADEAAGGVCVVSDPALPLHWWNGDGRSVYGYDPQAARQGFDTVLAASGGFYDTALNLQYWYAGWALSFGAFGGAAPAPAGYNGTDDTSSGYTLVGATPEGLPVTILAQTLSVPGKILVTADNGAIDFESSVNPCGLTLAYTRATGLLSGGFNVYYQSATTSAAYKTKACAYKGVLTPVRATGGSWSFTEGQGFYLIPEKTTYSFNRSYRLLLISQ